MNTETFTSNTAVFTFGLSQKGSVKNIASEYAQAYRTLDGLIEEQDQISGTFRNFLDANFHSNLSYSGIANRAKQDLLSSIDNEQPTEEQWADDNNWYRLLSHVLRAGGHEGLTELGGIAGRESQQSV
jgi:hypothetical protein